MDMLKMIQEQSERLIKELEWSEGETKNFVDSVNKVLMSRASDDDELDYSLVTHSANYSGGFILFGGWTKIFDHVVAPGVRGHELYLAFGGLGAGGWSGDCDIELNLRDGSIYHDGKRYAVPEHYYSNGSDDWENYKTAFTWFYDNVKSFMFMYLPQFAQPIPIFVYFDSHSNQIGISVPNASLSVGIGGGTVKVES